MAAGGSSAVRGGEAPASLSQQLAVLRRAGLVSTRREGSAVHYSVTSPHVSELLAVFGGRRARARLAWWRELHTRPPAASTGLRGERPDVSARPRESA